MAKMHKNLFAQLYAGEFGGIDRQSSLGQANVAQDIKNFRILADGSLEKRCGYSKVIGLPAGIRAVWSGDVDGEASLFVLAGDMVYLANPETREHRAVLSVGTPGGPACFFQVEGRLYLIDGQDVYSLSRTDGASVEGYVPLYGRDWTHAGGPVHEPVNQLSEYIRITYRLSESSATSVPTGIAAESVVSLIIDGIPKTSGYSLNGDMLKLGTTCALNTEIEVCLHIGGSYNERGELSSCSGTAVFGGKYDNSVYCFGGNDRSRVFRSKYVGAADLARSRFHVPGSMGLYFPVGYDFSVAAGSACVRAICRHYDRLLLFTADDARMTDLSESSYQDLPVRPVNSGVGCLSAGGVVLCDNDPMTVSRDGIYRWTSNTDERDESNAKRISEQLAGLLGRDFGAGALAFNYREADEIWIANPADPEGRVFVYNYRLEKWYCHTGISAEHFFRFGGRLGFCRAGDVFMFGEEEYTDCGAEIVAEYESRYTDMGQAGLKKRVKRVMVVSSAESDFTVELHNTGRKLCELHFEGRPGPGIESRRAGAYTGRTTYVKYCLKAGGPGRQRIFGIVVMADK
ncbi:MAG TPA: hypothetical protein GX011_07095 [Clostridiales bacterium]|nr:hypothetical protein [Clostridiales bacterium]